MKYEDDPLDGVTTMALGEGALLAGRYRVVRHLGQGGMGSVWLVEDVKLDNKRFAVKTLPAILVSNKRAFRQIKEEALVAIKLAHQNIVTLRAFEENDGTPFLVMDYVEGQTLDDYLADRTGGLPEAEAIRILRPIAAALDYAHGEGVVHRDVKPSNVMIRKDGHPFILDFGIAREMQETLTRVTGSLSSGTLLYMSPEQLHGAIPAKEQDVYSFAAMAYECLKGAPPFCRGQIEHQIDNDSPESLPRGLGAFAAGVMAGLAKNPEDRPKSCADVLDGRVPKAAHGRGKAKATGGAWKVLVAAAVVCLAAASGWIVSRQMSSADGGSIHVPPLAPEPAPAPAPKVEPAPAPKPAPEEAPAPKVEPPPAPKPKPAAEVAPAPKPEPPPAPKPKPAPEVVPAPKVEPPPAPAPKPAPEEAPAPKVEPPPAPKPKPAAEVAPAPKPEPPPAPKPKPAPEVVPAPKVEPPPAPAPKPAPEPVPVPKPEPPPAPKPAPAAEAAPAPAPVDIPTIAPKAKAFTVADLEALDSSALRPGEGREVTLTGGVTIALNWCPPGEFMMQSPQRQIHVQKGFWMGRYEVTQELWEHVLHGNPSRFVDSCKTNVPVDSISRDDCIRFVAELNKQNGTTGFRLPLDEEWEYACRAGTATLFNCGMSSPTGNMRAHSQKPCRTGSFKPNAWGLFDMHGNMAEWCMDAYPAELVKLFQRNGFVLRGGSYKDKELNCSSVARRREASHKRHPTFGMRLCFSVK